MRRTCLYSIWMALVGLLFSSVLSAQCSPSIPPYASQQDGTALFGVDGDTVWLCPGAQLDLESAAGPVNNVVVYAEENSFVRLDDTDGNDGNRIHIQNGGAVEVGSNATNTTIHHASSVNVTDNGTGTTTNDCGSISFDYSNAPPDNCNAQSLQVPASLRAELDVHSMKDRIRVEVPDRLLQESSALSIRIYDMLGKRVHEHSINASRSTMAPQLPEGVYHYRILKEGQPFSSGKLGLH